MLTRRQLLELGAVAWLSAVLGGARSARATGVDATAPAWLRRASWVPLTGGTFGVAGVTLQLTQVGDLPFLAGRDDAFRLELTGPAGALPGGIHQFQHPTLGSFELFVSPVDTVVDGEQLYEVVVNRSVGVPRSVPTAPSAGPTSVASTAPPALASTAPPAYAPTAPQAHAAPRRRRRKRRHPAHHLARRRAKLRAGRRPAARG